MIGEARWSVRGRHRAAFLFVDDHARDYHLLLRPIHSRWPVPLAVVPALSARSAPPRRDSPPPAGHPAGNVLSLPDQASTAW